MWCLWWRNVWRPTTTTCEIICYRETHFTPVVPSPCQIYIKSRAQPTLKQQQQTTEAKKQEQQQPSATITNLHQNHHQPLPTTSPCVSLSQYLLTSKNLHQQQQQLSNLKTRANKKQTTTKKITIHHHVKSKCVCQNKVTSSKYSFFEQKKI